MAKKLPSAVIGVDIGRHSIKTVSLQRKGGNRFIVNNYAVRVLETPPETPEALGAELKSVLKDLGASGNCAVAISSGDSIMRIIEQPETPRDVLRNAVRLNALTLLNQEVKEFVLDCEPITPHVDKETKKDKKARAEKESKETKEEKNERETKQAKAAKDAKEAKEASGGIRMLKYLVAGLPRKRVELIDTAFQQYRRNAVHNLQLAPICTFNAFEFANPEVWTNEAFLLLDIGHRNSTVTVGVKKEMVLVRAIDYGSQNLQEFLVTNGAPSRAEALTLLESGDETAVENARLSLTALTREVASSIGFFEGRREENITRVYVSGGGARSHALLKILSEELDIPCEAWDPFKTCEVAVPAARKNMLAADLPALNVACGAAAEALRR